MNVDYAIKITARNKVIIYDVRRHVRMEKSNFFCFILFYNLFGRFSICHNIKRTNPGYLSCLKPNKAGSYTIPNTIYDMCVCVYVCIQYIHCGTIYMHIQYRLRINVSLFLLNNEQGCNITSFRICRSVRITKQCADSFVK